MFEIDTGTNRTADRTGQFDYCQIMLDGVTDSMPANATQAEIDAGLARAIVVDLNQPKRGDTVRNHFIRYWPLVWPMADRSPASFDFVMQEFAERLAEFS